MGFLKKSDAKKDRQWKIKKNCLRLIFESARSSYPKEFGGLLRVDDDFKDLIVEVILLPGTISGDSHAIFRLHMLPIDFSIVGTVHSHPSNNPNPSNADLELFRKRGRVHIIAASPFDFSSWKAFNHNGDEIKLEII